MTQYFNQYARDNLEGKCKKEGYIRPRSSVLIQYSTPLVKSSNCIYNVTYECDVCKPEREEIYECKIIGITKIGIKAVISTVHNPILFHIVQACNEDIDLSSFKKDQTIMARIIETKNQLNEPQIEVIAEIIQ